MEDDKNQAKIKELEEENRSLKERNGRLEKKLLSSKAYAEELRIQAEKLSKELGEIKKCRILAEEVETQTTEEDFKQFPVNWEVTADPNGTVNHASIVDQVKATAEEVTRSQGMVFEERSGMYYDYNSGYYYDGVLGMWYDGSSGTYFHYDEETQTYEKMGQVTKEEKKKTMTRAERRERKRKKKERKERMKRLRSEGKAPEEGMEDGEVSSSSSSEISEDEDEGPPDPNKIPCVRMIVRETETEELKLGSLFVVTCMGGSIGREGVEHDVLIPDPGCSKYHGKITYDESKGKYYLTDLGSRNGTFINGKRISPAKVESDPVEIGHGSRLQIGKTIILCHVHPHLETCNGCEPGLIQAAEEARNKVVSTKMKESERKLTMKEMKKKYGLNGDETGLAESNDKYVDRAGERRRLVGSDNPHEKTEVASTQQSIKASNKGFKMLSKMGWKEGEGLGKSASGRAEPVQVELRPQGAGLGSSVETLTVDVKSKQKAELWRKTQERFSKINDNKPKED